MIDVAQFRGSDSKSEKCGTEAWIVLDHLTGPLRRFMVVSVGEVHETQRVIGIMQIYVFGGKA